VIERIEALLPVGVRKRQLCVRTLVLGILLCLADCRPAHLTRVHAALVALNGHDRQRLGVIVALRRGPHLLTYRQVERTAGLVLKMLSKPRPDGEPSPLLTVLLDALTEASIPARFKDKSTSIAIDWTDLESFSARRTKLTGLYTDREASWGHRKGGGPGEKDELFFGYYLSLATMVSDDGGVAVPELVRRMALTACDHDPVVATVEGIKTMARSGIAVGDVVADSGYAHRVPEHFAFPLRAVGASLVMDLHPHDRGMKGTYEGGICWNGNVYCPATPKALFELEPLKRAADEEATVAHDARSSELSHYKLGPICRQDADGYQRVACPATLGKLRCPLREDSMGLPFSRLEVLGPPEQPPSCCTKRTITVPPTVNAKTRQRHDYPSAAHRRSYSRRSAAERSNATVKDPASTNVSRGWCRLMGLVPISLFLACALATRNVRVIDSFEAREAEDARRLARGMAPKTRRRRRKTITDLVTPPAGNAPP
jgi:hypothetical protein